MKKYRVRGTGIHAIKLFLTEKEKKTKDTWYFDDLNEAKQQVLKNQQAEIARLLAEKEQAQKRVDIINEHIFIMTKPLDLSVVTDDYLIGVNNMLAELNAKIERGDTKDIL
jgi:hypothetical protein